MKVCFLLIKLNVSEAIVQATGGFLSSPFILNIYPNVCRQILK